MVIDVQKGIVALDRKLEPNRPAEVVANVSKRLVSLGKWDLLFLSPLCGVYRLKRHVVPHIGSAATMGF